MTRSDLVTKLPLALLGAALTFGAAACAGEVPDEGAGEETLGAAEGALTVSECLNYQRDVVGTAADATIWQDTPSYNMGAANLLYTGTSSAGFRQALVRFDISNVPAGARVDSSSLYLYQSYKDASNTVYVHEILAPWDESTVTWASFDGSFDPTPAHSFQAWSGGGQNHFHVEALVQKWVDGESENHGFLLQELGGNRTSFHSSEHATVSHHPKLRICYTITQ